MYTYISVETEERLEIDIFLYMRSGSMNPVVNCACSMSDTQCYVLNSHLNFAAHEQVCRMPDRDRDSGKW